MISPAGAPKTSKPVKLELSLKICSNRKDDRRKIIAEANPKTIV